MIVRDLATFVGMALSLDAAFFLSRAIRRPTRMELHDLGTGAILEGDYAGLFFGARSELVRSACMEWQYHRTGIAVLCVSVAAQMYAQVLRDTRYLHPLVAIGVPLSVAVLTALLGTQVTNRATASYIRKMVVAEVRRDRPIRRTPTMGKCLSDENRQEVRSYIRCLLSGLVPSRSINEFSSSILALLENPE